MTAVEVHQYAQQKRPDLVFRTREVDNAPNGNTCRLECRYPHNSNRWVIFRKSEAWDNIAARLTKDPAPKIPHFETKEAT